MRGIASRVQFGNTDWKSFTVRYKRSSGATTEYEKRKLAIYGDRGLLYPYLTVQAYVKENNEFMSAGVIKTKDLFNCLDDPKLYEIRKNKSDGNIFRFVRWSKIKKLVQTV
ncbi:hypothetical protein KKG85_01550 [Patescibacteria group bacterium]|nr:hypothetical protein [Patescibacteria group bacterium]